MRLKSLSKSLFAAGFLLTAAWACKTDDSPADPVPTFDVTVRDTKFGKVLTDQKGMTLYYFSKDVAGASTCTGSCLTAWPVFTAENLKLDAGLVAADFASIATPDGKKQITYKGWPLYYFNQDLAAGDVNGENVGNVWFVAKTTYSLMIASNQLTGNNSTNYIVEGGKYKEGNGATVYFTDVVGNTIYGFARDKKNTNTYTQADTTKNGTWPIFYTELADLPSTLDKSLFGKIEVFGKSQLTYKGWPLYYFGPDNKQRGMTKGVSVPQPGVWPVIQMATPAAPE